MVLELSRDLFLELTFTQEMIESFNRKPLENGINFFPFICQSLKVNLYCSFSLTFGFKVVKIQKADRLFYSRNGPEEWTRGVDQRSGPEEWARRVDQRKRPEDERVKMNQQKRELLSERDVTRISKREI